MILPISVLLFFLLACVLLSGFILNGAFLCRLIHRLSYIISDKSTGSRWNNKEKDGGTEGDTLIPLQNVWGGNLNWVKSIKRWYYTSMMWHHCRVTNRGINPTATPQRLPLPRPAFLIYHFLPSQTNTTLIHSCHCGYNGRDAKAWKCHQFRCQF